MIRHHPEPALLMSLSAGHVPAGPAVVLGAHAEHCAHCRAQLRAFDAVGGALLEGLAPQPLRSDALARTLARIDALPAELLVQAAATPIGDPDPHLPSLPDGAHWPRSLRGAKATSWRTLTPGVRWSRVTLPHTAEANVFALRVAAGKSLPRHSHHGGELTQVLYGAFDDGVDCFAAGDFDGAGDAVLHQPVVTAAGECVCLTAVDGRLAFEGPLARLVGSLLKI